MDRFMKMSSEFLNLFNLAIGKKIIYKKLCKSLFSGFRLVMLVLLVTYMLACIFYFVCDYVESA